MIPEVRIISGHYRASATTDKGGYSGEPSVHGEYRAQGHGVSPGLACDGSVSPVSNAELPVLIRSFFRAHTTLYAASE